MTIIYDLKGSLGCLSEEGYKASSAHLEDIGTWDGKVSTFVEKTSKTSFQRAIEDYHSHLHYESVKDYQPELKSPLEHKRNRIVDLLEEKARLMDTPMTLNTSIHLDDIDEEIKDLEIDIKRLEHRISGNEEYDESIHNYGLDGKVKYWSDYNKSYLHPKSLFINTSFSIDQPFDVYSWGTPNQEQRDEYMDRLRIFAEECENFEGFQCFVDVEDATGAAASVLLLDVKDEYGKKSMLTFGNLRSQFLSSAHDLREEEERKAINTVLSLSHLKDLSDLLIPLSIEEMFNNNHLNHVHMNPKDHYQTSAILAMAIENCTLPYRLNNRTQTLSKFISHLAPSSSTNIASLSASIPLPISEDSNLLDMFKNRDYQMYKAPFMQPLSPIQLQDQVTPYSESVFLRGIPECLLESTEIEGFGAMDLLFANLFHYKTPLRYYRAHTTPATVPIPFPQIFRGLTQDGLIANKDNEASLINSMPLLTHLQMTQQLKPYFESTYRNVENVNLHEHYFYEIDEDEFESSKESIVSLIDDYSL